MNLKNISIIFGLFSSILASAAGFGLYETSSRGVAMGGAVMGLYNDASQVYSNPALITDVKGHDILFGLSLINPKMDVELSGTGKNVYSPEDQWFPPPFLYYASKLTDDLYLGLGFYVPYGLGIKHATDWPGRFSSVQTEIQTYNFNPNLAWKVNDDFSVALGLDLMYFDITLNRNVPTLDRLLVNKADSFGYGANLALSYKINENFGIGLVYRSELIQKLEGKAHVDGMPQEYRIWEDLTLPQSVSLGANYVLNDWNFGLITTWTGWESYDNLTIHFKDPLFGTIPEFGSDKNWNNAWRIGGGVEYHLSSQSYLQAGYIFDQDPIEISKADYLLPPGDRRVISIGLRTLLTDNWEFGIAFARIFMKQERIAARPQDGVYDTFFKDGDARVVTVQLSRTF